MSQESFESRMAPRPIPLRTFLAFGGLAMALAGALVMVILKTPPPERARSLGARLELAAGQVVVKDADSEIQGLSGIPIATGARIETGKGARALVRTGDGAAVFLRGDTEVTLEPMGLSLEKGEAWLDAPRVEGEAIVCRLGKNAVSASDAGLSIARHGDDATVYVARGLAILTSPGGRVEINAGTQGSIAGASAPKVAPVAFWQDWTGGMGDARAVRGAGGSGSGRIYGLDPNALSGTPAKRLGIAKQVVHAVLRDGVAETEVDQTFSNPGGQPIEGWYWFTVPSNATVTSFALENNGNLVEGEVIERHEAAARYQAAVRQAVDPALLEWVDGRSYRARIYPIPANGTRRVVLRYIELLPQVEGKMRYVYPLRSNDPVRFDEFALSVDLGSQGASLHVATSLDATLEQGSTLVTMRRSGYVPQADFQLEMTPALPSPPVRAWRFAAGSDQADYVMLRYVPEVDFGKLPPAKGEVVVVVDTSAGGDESERAERTAAAEGILRALSDQDRFALVALDVTPTVVYPKEGLSAATDAEVAKALEKLADHGIAGATDLGAMFEPALERLHGAEQPAIVYVGDGHPTSGETNAEALMNRMRRSLSGSRARFFAMGVGADAHHELLSQLTRAGSGQYLRINEADETTGQALRLTSAIKTPTITDLEIDLGAGLDQPFYSSAGKLARGEELELLARTHHELPRTVTIKGRVAGEDWTKNYSIRLETSTTTSLVPRLWAAEYVRRLLGSGTGPDDNRSKVLDLGLEYGLMTPYTSILALESDEAYARQGVPRRTSKLRGVRLTSIQSERQEKDLVAPFLTGSTAAAMGCDRSAPASAEATATSDKSATVAPTPQSGGAAFADPSPPEGLATAAAAPPPSPPPAAAPRSALQGANAALVSGNSAAELTRSPAGTSDSLDHMAAHEEHTERLSRSPAGTSDSLDHAPADQPGIGVGAGFGNGHGRLGTAPAPPSTPFTKHMLNGPRGSADATTGFGARQKEELAAKKALEPPRLPAPPPLHRVLATCSDAASRPLAERIVLWQKRLRRATGHAELIAQYEAARSSCELPDWRDEEALLDLVQARIDNEEAAGAVLTHFRGEVEAQRYVARAILRRTVDPRLSAAVSRALFGDRVDWTRLDRELLDIAKPEDRIVHLKAAMLVADGDPAGDARLVKLLVSTGHVQEAIAHGRRLRDRGLMTPLLAEELGDALVIAGEQDEALRTYSEVVEFNGDDPLSRRLLGDIFLRNGWYDAAYRQYKTLTDLDPKNATSWLRLAAAAAGAGRVDEALRVEREVQSGEGSPGPDDPRFWARLWSSARLGALLNDPQVTLAGSTSTQHPPTNGSKDAIARKLKELGLFSGPGTLALLTWEDHDARLVMGAADPKKEDLRGEPTDAGPTGLYGVLLGQSDWDTKPWAVRFSSDAPSRPVAFALTVLSWDGRNFAVKISKGQIKPDDKMALL
jgi:Ca-activated chloride channel homolog